MTEEILTRILWALLILGGGALLYQGGSQWLHLRARQKTLGIETLKPGVPAVLYFTTPTCMPCKTVQRPAIQQLQNHLGENNLQVIEVDASVNTELADYWGVLSVPTTFLIDSRGQARRVNHGVTRADKLFEQLQNLESRPRSQVKVLAARRSATR